MVTLVLFLCHFQIDISFTKASLRDVVSKVERCPKVSSVTNFDVLSLADNFFLDLSPQSVPEGQFIW